MFKRSFTLQDLLVYLRGVGRVVEAEQLEAKILDYFEGLASKEELYCTDYELLSSVLNNGTAVAILEANNNLAGFLGGSVMRGSVIEEYAAQKRSEGFFVSVNPKYLSKRMI